AGEQFVRCRFVVAADGQNSGLRREAGLNRVIGERRRYGFRRHYRVLPWSRDMELYWGPRGQIYVTPVSAHEVCLALLTQYRALRLDEALNDFPELRARVAGAAHASREQGALTVSRSLARVCRNDLALVGDASGSIDAVTGEGICLSFRQSLALAAALRSGNLKDYEAEHHSLSKRPRIMARLMLTLDDHVSLQRRALAGLAEQRDIFASLLAIHVGAASFADLISSRLFGFCRKFLVA
ncbi:MAG: FAD-dependent monooxygenase, partial [Acidobacteriaceae bacterium]|nr:FAD-dependent monooxygenase [Acidobacteriaceae bacterium]